MSEAGSEYNRALGIARLVALFALLPMLAVVVLSFTAYDGLSAPRWTGLDNWVRLGSDPLFTESLQLSFVLTAVSWVVQTAVALPLGVWLAGRGRSRASAGRSAADDGRGMCLMRLLDYLVHVIF